jgi:hypothetical protein
VSSNDAEPAFDIRSTEPPGEDERISTTSRASPGSGSVQVLHSAWSAETHRLAWKAQEKVESARALSRRKFEAMIPLPFGLFIGDIGDRCTGKETWKSEYRIPCTSNF